MAALLGQALTEADHEVRVVSSGERAIDALRQDPYDLVLLDVMLPRMDGMPILMLTARDDVEDRVRGLDAGADDYLCKPFSLDELLARVRALERRGPAEFGTRIAVGPLLLDTASPAVWRDGERVDLTARECAVLEVLMREPGRVVRREKILDHAWPDGADDHSNVLPVDPDRPRTRISTRRAVRPYLRSRPITVRITAGFLCAMALLFALTGAFIYERMSFALNRSIRDVPSENQAEISARRRHRDEALHELLGQLAPAFAGTLLVTGYVGHRVAGAALDPVERMRRRAGAECAVESFRLPVPDTRDELARLAETLNELLARVEAGVRRQQRLIADASHELRTPLSQLLLRVDLALSRERSPEELLAALVDIQQDTQRLVRLAKDLLLIARADDGRLPLRPRRLALHAVAAEAARRFEEAARREDRSIAITIDPALEVEADRDRLAQALDTLIDNAMHHGDGTVTVSATTTGATVTIEVHDEGPGFAAGFAAHAFDRFSTSSTGRTGSGAGLGLAIVAAIAGAHGGRAAAADGAGGRVRIELPAGGRERPRSPADRLGAEDVSYRREGQCSTSTPSTSRHPPTRSTRRSPTSTTCRASCRS